MPDMFGVLERIKEAPFESPLAQKFQSYAIQKLTLSILKNTGTSIPPRTFPTLLKNLLSNPTSLVLLIASKHSRKMGENEN
jgi:hypothetical protein